MTEPAVTLRAFTRAGMAIVERWFRDTSTRQWLGGPKWPANMLARAERVVGGEFRGAVQTGAYRYLAHSGGQALGYVDCRIARPLHDFRRRGTGRAEYHRRARNPNGSIAFVVDPDLRRRGLGRAMIAATLLFRIARRSVCALVRSGRRLLQPRGGLSCLTIVMRPPVLDHCDTGRWLEPGHAPQR